MRVVILGGGLSGMAAAYCLMDHADVTIVEKEDHLGGLASSFEHAGYRLPMFYHHIFTHDTHTLKYFREFGIHDTIRWKRVKVGIAAHGRLWDFVSPLHLLRFSYLSPLARVKYGWFGLRTLFTLDASKISNSLDARTWLMKTAGREITDKIFVPLYAENKFNIPLEQISAKQFAMRLINREILGRFGYPTVGLDSFVSRFEGRLSKKVTILKGAPVSKIDLESKEVAGPFGTLKYDAVVNTLPIPEFLNVTKHIPEVVRDKYSQVKYCPAVEVAFATSEHLSDHYWLNVFHRRFGMLFQHSILHDGYPFKFHWALRYGGSENDFPLPDEQIYKAYMHDVKEITPVRDVLWYRVFRTKYAEPIFTADYASVMPKGRSRIQALYNAGTATVFPRIRNMDASIQSGERVAKYIKTDFDLPR